MEAKTTYNCIIIDDEPIAIRVIQSYLEKLDDFKVLGAFTNALDALKVLHAQAVDLLFLDIQMPGINGMEFFRSMQHRPKVIFTTAFRNYAADAFDLDALDYLLKPIPFDRFLKAVNKFLEQQPVQSLNGYREENQDFIVVKSNKKNHKVMIEDIRYVESLDDYVKIHLRHKSLVCYLRLAALGEQINDPALIRVHRSYIVNLKHVSVFTHYELELEGTKIPVGRKYRSDTIKCLSERKEH
ncbi:LytR/AlgR family response regulator transcription factor [Roseimarinus sediminis]|jgi:DNA-binding LytR/AlgR family response regulator|uniref:LytR/AlgR family response regulator transcription factor n=1 Tax=Roseimarinus sediminis TaxID=1610899 RepID=UPI003D203AF9